MKNRKFIYLLGFIFSFFSINFISAQVLINELVSSNSSGIEDPDFNDTGDWIELYNTSATAIDLSGYYLTDNLGAFDKWQFPIGTEVDANGYLVVWADGADTGLHTSFKLTKAGEEVGLFDAQGNLLDSIIYNHQQTDISFGRKTDGSTDWGFFETPTPNQTNASTAFDGIVFYRPTFSVKGGFYSGSMEVEIDAIDGDIRYTLDGSLPTINSPLYVAPLLIEETTILRARVFINNYISGKANTQSYFINENLEERKLPIISIATNPDYFWDADIGLYVQNFKPNWEYPINIELFENDGGNRAAFNELGGVKVNGENSWVLPQKMLGIYFDNEYDENNLEYPLFFDRRRNQYDNFTLRVGGSDWSATIFRDGLCQGLTRGRMNLSSMGFRPSIVFVNGEYLGIHNMRSRIDEGFIEGNYGLAGNEYDLIENNGVVEQGDAIAFNELLALMDQDLSIQSNFDAVATVMDIENYMDFYITEIWTSNSSYGHNIQFWKPKSADSKWRWIAQDFDRGFTGSGNDLIARFSTNPHANYQWVASGFENMLENEAFADLFMRRFADHLYTTFHPNRVLQHINEKEATIEMEMPYQIARWLGTTSTYGDAIPSFNFWKDEVEELRSFAEERQGVLFDDLINHFAAEETTTLGVLTDDEKGGTVFINEMSIPEPNWVGTYLKDLSFNLMAVPNVGYDFQGWSVDSLSVLIPKESVWKYYDQGNLPATNWNTIDYIDDSWSAGPAQLGYGDDDENTVVDYGGIANDKHITTYFRKTFSIEDPSQFGGEISINLMRDDGAVVYLNGVELIRSNMPAGIISTDTEAIEAISLANENVFLSFMMEIESFQPGENVIAVEIHQERPNSSDISFDLELLAAEMNSETIFSTDETISVELTNETFFVAHYLPNTNCLLPDTIATPTTLTIDCSPYLARKSVTILPDVTLMVEAGVEIHFPNQEGLVIQGDLQVEGTEALPVRFLPNTAAGATAWRNLYFENATDTSSLVWLEIMGASRGTNPIKEDAAIAAWNSTVEINHLTLVDNFQNPILGRHADIWLRNSQLHSKVTGDLINVKYGYGFIDNCDFRGNDQVDTDAIDYDEVVDGVIRNSKIYNFQGFNSDGIDLGEVSENILIENNFIHHIADKGISVGQQSTIQLVNNTIVECNQGLGIKDEGIAMVDQNTFYNNAFDIVAFEKNIGIGGGHIEVSNTLFSNTAFDPISIDLVSSATVDFSLFDTKELVGNNIILDDPLFENPTQNDFQLRTTSPAINAGMDAMGNPINLGTKSHLYSASASLLISAIHYHPIDDTEEEFIRIYNPSNETILLEGYEVTDGVRFIFPANTSIAPGETIHLVENMIFYPDLVGQVFEWTSGKLSNDGEQIILSDKYGIIVDHVTYNDQLPWPTAADGEGAYLELIHPDLDNHFAKNWEAVFVDLTSIETLNPSSKFTIAPNPTDDVFRIRSSEEKINVLSLYDAFGRRLFTKEVNDLETSIEMAGFPSGVYFLSINFGEVRKVVKR